MYNREKIINFGKFEGTQLQNIPNDYLEWIINNFDEDDIWYYSAEKELEFRQEEGIFIENEDEAK